MKLSAKIDRFTTAGLILLPIFAQWCLILFCLSFVLNSDELIARWKMWIFMAFVILSIGEKYFWYRSHRCIYPLLLTIAVVLFGFYGYYFHENNYRLYFMAAAVIGLFVATVWNNKRIKMDGTFKTHTLIGRKVVALQSRITCPECGHRKVETMPTDACIHFYECENCKKLLKPLPGDCCVYCSYGTEQCPPMQAGTGCC